MNKFFLCILFAVSLFTASCSVNSSEVTDEYAKDFIKKVKYVKDEKTGLCYAIVGTRKTGDTDQNGISWTYVPCDSVQQFLIKK